MIYPAEWLIKNRIIYAYAEGIVSLLELHEHSQRVHTLLDEGTAPVHIILESSPDFHPERVDLRSGLDSLRFVYHPSIGWTVQILEGNHGMRFVARLIARFARISYQSVKTRREALEFLRMMDDSLDWSQSDESIFYQDV